MQLPPVVCIEAQRLRYLRPSWLFRNPHPADLFLLIGTLGGIPFLLVYDEGGLTRWTSDADLTEPARRKILQVLRKTLRQATTLPAWCTSIDLTALPEAQALEALASRQADFTRTRYREAVLGDRAQDYVDLVVPFAEKDQAKAAGAVWDPGRRVWRANMTRLPREDFARWLPE